jgi:anaerobic dimethyl sulfoxide reductase subunit B (iron-sulfur subunit)
VLFVSLVVNDFMTYAFTFDASACTGCKACQIACKDKNNLPLGVLWRRVYEVSGGSWNNVGAGFPRPETWAREPRPYDPTPVWETDVFAYNLSIACNHCVHPKCAGVCPTDAYVQRADGIVYIDESKCMGCGYCAWACPYAAPQYNPARGHMTKCDFCFDNLDAGLPPSCVSACPLRVLDCVEIREQRIGNSDQKVESSEWSPANKFQPLWETAGTEHPFPLPTYSRTQPHLAIKFHAGMENGLEKTISNREEVNPPHSKVWPLQGASLRLWSPKSPDFGLDELPLIIFTLCAQMAAGMAVVSLFAGPLSMPTLITIGGLIGVGGLASIFHLGAPMNAWRALNHLRKSWLSREVLMFGLFGATWLAWTLEHWLLKTDHSSLITALTGIGLVYSMGQVYRLRSVPAWNNWRTFTGFFVTALLLGEALTAARLSPPAVLIGATLALLLALQFWLVRYRGVAVQDTAMTKLRLGLIFTGVLGADFLTLAANQTATWMKVFIILMIITEEVLGRWQFYRARRLTNPHAHL